MDWIGDDNLWYFNAGCYEAESGDINITALWSPNNYTQQVNHYIHNPSNNSYYISHTEYYNIPYGSNFIPSVSIPNWYTILRSNFGTSINDKVDLINGYTVYDSKVVDIVYTPWQHVVHYDGNASNVSNIPMDGNKIFGIYYAFSSQIPIRAGYEFFGWTESKDGSGTVYYSNDAYPYDRNGEGVTWYAQWKDITPPQISIIDSQMISNIETLEGIDSVQLNINAIDYESGMKSLRISELSSQTDLIGEDITSEFASGINNLTGYIKGYITERGIHYYKITAIDNENNISTKVFVVNVITMNATIVNMNNNSATSFLRADRGLLEIKLYGFIEKLEITYPDILMNENFDLIKIIDLVPKVEDTYDEEFTIPLYDVPDGNYTIMIKAIKGDKAIYSYPIISVSGSVLNEFKNAIKTYPKTKWNIKDEGN